MSIINCRSYEREKSFIESSWRFDEWEWKLNRDHDGFNFFWRTGTTWYMLWVDSCVMCVRKRLIFWFPIFKSNRKSILRLSFFPPPHYYLFIIHTTQRTHEPSNGVFSFFPMSSHRKPRRRHHVISRNVSQSSGWIFQFSASHSSSKTFE